MSDSIDSVPIFTADGERFDMYYINFIVFYPIYIRCVCAALHGNPFSWMCIRCKVFLVVNESQQHGNQYQESASSFELP